MLDFIENALLNYGEIIKMADKIIFLDIDGVLLCHRHIVRGFSSHSLPDDTIEILNNICEKTGSKVVITSTWRKDKYCRDTFFESGFHGKFHRDWRTPVLETQKGILWVAETRWTEINTWLQKNEYDDYIILDDLDNDISKNTNKFILIDTAKGLTQEIADIIIEKFNSQGSDINLNNC